MSRSKVLGLYRALLREAKQMPTENRRQFVRLKARDEFRKAAALSEPHAVEFSIALAETQLDNVTRQRQLLNELRDEAISRAQSSSHGHLASKSELVSLPVQHLAVLAHVNAASHCGTATCHMRYHAVACARLCSGRSPCGWTRTGIGVLLLLFLQRCNIHVQGQVSHRQQVTPG